MQRHATHVILLYKAAVDSMHKEKKERKKRKEKKRKEKKRKCTRHSCDSNGHIQLFAMQVWCLCRQACLMHTLAGDAREQQGVQNTELH